MLCGGGSNLPEIVNKLKSVNWGKRLPFARRPTVHFMKPSEIQTVKDSTGLLTTVQDITPMALANLAIDLVGDSTASQNLLRRLVSSVGA